MRLLTAAIGFAVVLAVSPVLTWAQAGWYVTPSLTLTEEFDDNIFGVPSGARLDPTARRRESDFITRITPGITLGYRSEPLTLLGNYSLDAEIYADHSELNDVGHRHRAGLEFRYRPNPQLTYGLTGSYTRTETTADFLAPSTTTAAPGVPGVDVGRRRASALVVAPLVSYQFDPQNSGEAGYTYTRTDVSGADGSTDWSHAVSLLFGRQFTPLDRGTLRYRVILFDSDEADSLTSHAVLVGWRRQLTERTLVTLEVGPRLSDGDLDVEAFARLEHRLRQATLALSYTRTEALVIGRAGPSTTDTVLGSVTYEPLRALVLDLVASVARIDSSDRPDATVYGVGASASYRLTEWLTTRLYYRFSQSEEDPDTIRHHVVGLSLEFSYPIRVD